MQAKEHPHRGWRIDTDLLVMYEIPNLLSSDECEACVAAIESEHEPSGTIGDNENYRTSATSYLEELDDNMKTSIHERIALCLGVDVRYGEGLQGQRYLPGQYYKDHLDPFENYAEESDDTAMDVQGNRTWTVMVYLNNVDEGGHTNFPLLGRSFAPVCGTALAWLSLTGDRRINPFSEHAGLDVVRGRKYILNSWWREHLVDPTEPELPESDDDEDDEDDD